MTQCSNCGRKIPKHEIVCPYCKKQVSSRKAEVIKEIETYGKRVRNSIATFLLGMFGIWILPFRTLILVLAIVSFVIAPATGIYYTWKKRGAEERLEKLDRE